MPIDARSAGLACLAFVFGLHAARARDLPALTLEAHGRAQKVFDTVTDRCGEADLPDVNARAFRAPDGRISMFALQFVARALRGPDLDHLKIDCRVALDSHEDADPAKYDGRRYITSTWTKDGVNVAALVHDEYHADVHPGRCSVKSDLGCWWNTILAFRSTDGGASFAPSKPLVVAATPFRQDVGQGRHRGFFNPSNMFAKDGYVYAFVSTTGWTGQTPGACLIRNRDPMNSAGWRGWDGRAFTVRWRDPYAPGPHGLQAACAPLEPFGYPVGAVVRYRPTGEFLALWEAPRVPGRFATTGFYYATSRDLLRWSAPALFAPTAISHAPCGENEGNRDGWINTYPSLIDDKAQGRNFDDVGADPWIYFAHIKNVGCIPAGQRILMRQRVSIRPRGR